MFYGIDTNEEIQIMNSSALYRRQIAGHDKTSSPKKIELNRLSING